MLQSPNPNSQNCDSTFVNRSPNGSVIHVLVPATPSVEPGEEGDSAAPPDEPHPGRGRSLTPFVVRDTFDSGTPSPPHPPLTQLPRRMSDAGHGPGDADRGGRGVGRVQARDLGPMHTQNARSGSLPPSSAENTPVGSPLPWGSSPTALSTSPMSVNLDSSISSEDEAEPPTPAARAAIERDARARARAQVSAPTPAATGTQAHDNLPVAGPPPSQTGTDYFAFFHTPPALSATPRAGNLTLPDITRAAQQWPASSLRRLQGLEGGRRHASQGGDVRRHPGTDRQRTQRSIHLLSPYPGHGFYYNEKKRLYDGSPGPEEVQRSRRRPRRSEASISLPQGLSTGLASAFGNPWQDANDMGVRHEHTEPHPTVAPLLSPFVPLAASTPPASNTTRSAPQAPALEPRDPPAPNATERMRHRGVPSDGRTPAALHPREQRRERAPPEATPGQAADRGPMEVDVDPPRDSSPEPAPRRNKGKGRAKETGEEPLEETRSQDPGARDEGWSHAQLLEARQRSLQQYVELGQGTRAGSAGGSSSGNATSSRSSNAGPSRTGSQQAPRHEGAGTYERTLHDGQAQRTGRERGAHAAPRPTRDNEPRQGRDAPNRDWRSPSAYFPAPNTRAAQFLASNARPTTPGPTRILPQRSPVSRIASLQRSPTYLSDPRSTGRADWRSHLSRSHAEERSVSRDVRMSDGEDEEEDGDDEEALDEDWSNDAPPYEWNLEAGEILPDALRGDDLEHDGDPTEVPEGGFPTVYRDDPGACLRGMARQWVKEVWSDPPNTGLILDVYNYQYSEDDAYNGHIEDLIRRQIERITGEVGFDVVPPEIEEGVQLRPRDLPTIWAVRNLSPRGVTRVLARRAWSFNSITFLTSPRATSMSTWLFTLGGLLRGDEAKIIAAIRRVLDEPAMTRWMERMISTNPDFAGWPEGRAMRVILRSLRVETMPLGNGRNVTNVWMLSPTRDVREWRRWIADLRARRYRTYAIGTGKVRPIVACAGCRSVTHPTHLCPFATIIGWNGPGPGDGVFGERRNDGNAGRANDSSQRGDRRRQGSRQQGGRQRDRDSERGGRQSPRGPGRYQRDDYPPSRGGQGRRGNGSGGGYNAKGRRRY